MRQEMMSRIMDVIPGGFKEFSYQMNFGIFIIYRRFLLRINRLTKIYNIDEFL